MVHASAGQTQDQNDPTAALKPCMTSSGSPAPENPMACSESFSSPVVSLPGSVTDTVAISQDSAHSKQLSSVATDLRAAANEINLLTDPSDGLLLGSDGVENDHAMCDDLFLGSHHDLPDDPLEGLCIPSWQDLLNEAVSEFNPQETLRPGPPGDAGGIPHAYRAAHESSQGCSWDFPALSEEGPVQKRVKTGDSGTTQGSSTLLSWDHPQDQCQTLSIEPKRSSAREISGSCTVGKSDFDVQPADVQARMHTSSGKRETRSDKLDQEAQQMMMMEISSVVNGAQHAQHQPKPAADQKRRVGSAKRAKRAMVGCKGQGKRAVASQAQGKVDVSMSGQGQGQRPQGASLGKLLPFDSLKVRIVTPS